MSLLSWFVADDNDKVVAKVDVHSDGTVHEYRYTVPDDISKGHGHYIYEDIEHYYDDEILKFRDENDEESKDLPWNGNGYNMSIEQLIKLREFIINQKCYNTNQLLLKKSERFSNV